MPEVYADEAIRIELLPALGSIANNAYILRPTNGGPLTIVDLPEGAEAIVEAVGDAEVERLVVTHSHFDHWGGYDVVRAATEAPVFAGAEETNLEESRNVQPLAHGDTFDVGDATVEVRHTPGHTPGSICLVVGGAVLTGDTLFPGGPGHSRSNELLEQEIASITSQLHPLPAETLVLPGHGDSTTIGASREEYAVFASKEHAPDLHGDVLWLES
jgi:hydroxyacylglutathione hydrolase